MNSLLIRFIVSVAFASGTLALMADIVSAQEYRDDFQNLKTVLVNNPTATIAQKKTPWIFVRPDGKSGFANDFTTNAISVVSDEDGINFYAHVEGENGDRTKVIHFTVDENGIPSKHGDVIDTTASGEENNAEEMKKRKLIGANYDGYLYFYCTDSYGVPFIYHPERGMRQPETDYNYQTGNLEPRKQKCLSYDPSSRYILYNLQYFDQYTGKTEMKTCLGSLSIGYCRLERDFGTILREDNVFMRYPYIGGADGIIYQINGQNITQRGRLPGPVSSLSGATSSEVFATTPVMDAFFNVTFGGLNKVKNGTSYKTMIPPTKDGLIRVINNRRNGKVVFVTTNGIHTVDN